MKPKEGNVKFKGFETHYYIWGDPSKSTPLLGLHGGPGYPHYHIKNLSQLAEKGIPVVLYDQLGCGQSSRPDDPKLWTVELFIDELKAVRKQLKLSYIYLFGHSWGGTLAASYMLTKPKGVEKLILSSPLLDSRHWVSEANRLKKELPDWAEKTMNEHEAAGTTDSWEYEQAYDEFVKRFVNRVVPTPELSLQAGREMSHQVYKTMWGPSENHATGILKDFNIIPKLHEINVPTLFISGKYDECTPAQIENAKKEIPGAKWKLMENSSHSAYFEETEMYLTAIETFIH